MLRSKVLFGLFTLVLVLALAPSSFAQVSVSVFPNAAPQEIDTNRAAEINDPTQAGSAIQITGTQAAQVLTTATLMTIDFGVAISSGVAVQVYGCPANVASIPPFLYSIANTTALTNSPACPTAANIPVGDAIRIDSAAGFFGGATGVSIWTVDYANGIITFALPHTPTGNLGPAAGSTGSFRVPGIRLDSSTRAGTTAAETAAMSLANSANNYILSTPSPITVISAYGAGIGSFAQAPRQSTGTNNGTFTIFTNRTAPDVLATTTVTEGFASAWLGTAQYADGSMSNGRNIRLTFNGVPAGVTLTIAIGSTSTSLGASLSGTSITSSTNTRTVTITNAVTTTTDAFEINVTGVTVSSTATLNPGAITVTASMFPVGTPFAEAVSPQPAQPTAANGYPLFLAAEVGTPTIGNIVAASTTMLMPYAVKISVFDTGLAVSNTSLDNFGTVGGAGGAVATAGTVTLDFFPTATAGGPGAAFSLTTSSTIKPGAGLSSDGTLAAGAVWTALLSDLLTAAGKTGDFVGYVIIRANFLNGHGTATISDFRTYSLTANVLVLAPPAISSRSAPGSGVETLGN